MKGAVLPSGDVIVSVHRDRLPHHHLLHVDTRGEVRTLTPEEPFALHDEPVAFGESVLVLCNRGRDQGTSEEPNLTVSTVKSSVVRHC
jgi:hypothetical protein